jgi:hypothetical protein
VPQEFKYRAFISYSHRDRATAEWLHKALENYRIPKELQGSAARDGPVPKQLFPIFRDRDELSSSSDLSQSIKEALEASACLIVICSPAAAKSRWVNQEILSFVKLGRRDRIHALIAEGEPGASPSDGGCFPPALYTALGPDGQIVDDPSHEVVAADLREEGDGKDDAKLKLIAGLLGIPFNSLRRREIVAARRRRNITLAVAGLVAVLILAVGVTGGISLWLRQESDERQLPGLRVETHETTLDLTGWRETTAEQIAKGEKISSALASDKYVVIRTQMQARNYVHLVGTSSNIPPDIMCARCTISARYRDDGSRAPNEFKVTFDISNLKLEDETVIEYQTRYWNAFQTPDQLWAGIRISNQTETATFTIIFPAAKKPTADKIKYLYHDTKDHPLDTGQNVTFEYDAQGRVSRLVWTIAHPTTDRSYRVFWDWNDARPSG